jgi:hypothetical protein
MKVDDGGAARKKKEEEAAPGPLDKARDEPKKLIELERIFGAGWYARYRNRPPVDSVFGTKK